MRYKEFADEWIISNISNAFTLLTNNSLSRDDLNYDCGCRKNIHYGDILTKYTTVKNITDNDVPYINDNIKISNSSIKLISGDIIVADTAEDYTVGKAIEIYDPNSLEIYSGLHTIPLRPKHKFAVGYLAYYFNSYNHKKRIFPLIQGIKVYSISKSALSSSIIKFPTLEEQDKIAQILIKLDARISTQKKIIEDIELLKKQLRNNIFTVYYSSFQPLKNLYIKGKAGGTPKTTNKEYYDGDIPFLSITDITSSGKYIDNCLKNISKKGLENSSAWIVPAGSLILSMYASVGLPCINKIELATSQAMFSMILKKGINIDYIYEYLKYFKENKLETYLEKGTQSNINSNIVENILIPLPDEEKISKIVNILTSIDKKIDNEKSILQLYIKQKEYLLNKLFI